MDEAKSDCYGSMGRPSARRAEAAANPCVAGVAADAAAAAVELAVVVATVVAAAVELVEPVVDGGRECACWAMRSSCCSPLGLRGMVRGRLVGLKQGRRIEQLIDLVKGMKSDLDNWQADVTAELQIVAAVTWTERVQKSRSRSRSDSRGRSGQSERSGRPGRFATRRRGGC